VAPVIEVLKRRADFLAAAASGFKFVRPSVVVQARKRPSDETLPGVIRIGFTATRKLGNAPVRNRVKRRMRETARRLVPDFGMEGCDYVFIGRDGAYKNTYDNLIHDMKHALKRLADQMAAANTPESET
jgi:ribonuclease P protein component